LKEDDVLWEKTQKKPHPKRDRGIKKAVGYDLGFRKTYRSRGM
jgi:hypothetical protein